MLDSTRTGSKLNGRFQAALKTWLHERQKLISSFFELSAQNPARTNGQKLNTQKLEKFCEVLVDYVSAGHFEIYQALLPQAKETSKPEGKLASKLYPALVHSTEHALTFNDKYANEAGYRKLLDDFSGDLSELGEGLEERFELEDLLISTFAQQQGAHLASA